MISHGEEITINKFYDGQIIATVHEVEQQQFTDKQYLMRDIIDSISVITSGQTRKLTIEVSLDKQDRYKLTSKWRVL